MQEKIKTKEQSKNKILALDLNRVPEIFVDKTDKKSMLEFFAKNTEELYIVRDAEHSNSAYFYVRSADECFEKAQNFSGRVIVAVSIHTYKNKLLLGAVEIAGTSVRICATTDSNLDHRTMYHGKAEFELSTDIFDKRLSDIPEFDFLYDYIISHRIDGYTVEFTIYDRPVGPKKQKIIINEIRNY
ncbi:MAG: hypothetical protein J1G05_04930 [Clostridiales bacterium]|nr:hypothetical protein [Clostridiales bacterium]